MEETENRATKRERNRNDHEVRAKHRVVQRGLRRHHRAPSRSAVTIRFKRTIIVCKQPAIITKQVQSRMVSLPESCKPTWQDPYTNIAQAPRLSATIRHGFDMIPPNSRRPPIAWPKSPTYAVNKERIAAQ